MSTSESSKMEVTGPKSRSDVPTDHRLIVKYPDARHLKPQGITRKQVKVVRDPKREPPVKAMFRQRMQREGRAEELRQRVRAVIEETGMGYSSALQVVMPQMGFLNNEAEIILFRRHQEECLEDAMREQIEGPAELEEEERKAREEEKDFEAALATLPPNAEKWRELDWIQAHPAMMRESRQKARGDKGPVVITALDILDAPHGACPSRSAAVQLQHWANNSAKFFEQIMSEAKKKSSDAAGGDKVEGEVEDDLSEIEDLLNF